MMVNASALSTCPMPTRGPKMLDTQCGSRDMIQSIAVTVTVTP